LPDGRKTVDATPDLPINSVFTIDTPINPSSLLSVVVSAIFRKKPFVPILLLKYIMSTKPSDAPPITVSNAFPTDPVCTGSKSKSTLFNKLSVNPAITKVIPEMPAIPNPGITKSSSAINTRPIRNRRISQLAAKPSMYNGAK